MASNTSYPRRYYATTYTQLSTIPLKEGNVISIGDTDGLYYDISSTHPGSGDSVVRRKASAVRYVSSLQDAAPEPEIIYVITSGTIETAAGATIPKYNGYVLDTVHSTDTTPVWLEIFNNLEDFNVKNTVDNSGKLYITGSTSNTDDIGTLSKNTNVYIYNDGTNIKLHANLEGKADEAYIADQATQAVNDTNNINLLNYIKNLTVSSGESGSTLIVTHGNNTQDQIPIGGTTPVSVYDETTAGIVNGWGTQVSSDSSGVILSGDGWITPNNLSLHAATADTATSATNDSNSNAITTYYLHNITYNSLDKGIYTVDGAGTTSTNPVVTLPDVFTTSLDGLVPAASASGDTSKFLRGDGTWQDMSDTIPMYQGSTPGLVPQGTGATGTFLQEDGTWATSNTTGSFNSSDKLYIVGATYQQTSTPVVDHTQTSSSNSITLDLTENVYLGKLEAAGQLSGYDSILTIDGSESWAISTTGTNYQEFDCTSLLTDNASTDNIIVSSMEVIGTSDVESVSTIAWVQVADTTGRIVVNKTWAAAQSIDITDITTFTTYLNDNAFTLWYRSSNYTSTSNQYYVASIADNGDIYANVGTIDIATYLGSGDKIDFAAGKITRSDTTKENVATNTNINYIQGEYTITATSATAWSVAWAEDVSTSPSPITNTNSNVYIDNDSLYSNGQIVATSSEVANAIDSLWPVGSVHITVQAYTDPVPLPGTWTYLGSGSMLEETMHYYKRIS